MLDSPPLSPSIKNNFFMQTLKLFQPSFSGKDISIPIEVVTICEKIIV
jgi:hypothetical protein